MRLSYREIVELHHAIVSVGLAGSRAGLLTGIAPGFVATIPLAATPTEQLLIDLDALSTVGALADGTTPLAVWLSNAITLAGGRAETARFERALDRVTRAPPGDMLQLLFEELEREAAAAPFDRAHHARAARRIEVLRAVERGVRHDPRDVHETVEWLATNVPRAAEAVRSIASHFAARTRP